MAYTSPEDGDLPGHPLSLIRLCCALYHGVQRRIISVEIFFVILRLLFCFVVAICDLEHDVETIFHLSYLLTASGNLF